MKTTRSLALVIPCTLILFTGPVMAQMGPAKVVAASAEMRPLPVTASLVGTVEPVRRSVIGAEVAGLVIEMPTRQGDLVEAESLLCKLNDDVLSLQLEREEARLSALQAQLDELLNGTRQEILDRLKAEYEAAEAMSERWEFELKRVERLQGGDYANEREYQDALAEQRAAKARMLAAKAQYEEAVAGPRQETIANARFAVAEQKAVTDRLRTELEKTKIKAPFTGNVVQRFAEVGTWLPVGGNVVELADLSTVLVRIDAPERAIPYAKVGSPATVYFDALQDWFDGTIRHVIPQAARDARTFPVEIAIENPEQKLKAGMFARATVPAGPSEMIVAIPKDALIESAGTMKVALIVPGAEGKMAIPTPVTLGADEGDWIAVTSGNVPAGAQVAVYGNERLFFPQPVQVVGSREEVDASAQPPSSSATADSSHQPKG